MSERGKDDDDKEKQRAQQVMNISKEDLIRETQALRAYQAEAALLAEKGAVVRRTVSIAPPDNSNNNAGQELNRDHQAAEANLLTEKRALLRNTVSIGIVPTPAEVEEEADEEGEEREHPSATGGSVSAAEDGEETVAGVSVAATTVTNATPATPGFASDLSSMTPASGVSTSVVGTATNITTAATNRGNNNHTDAGSLPVASGIQFTESTARAAVPTDLERGTRRASVPGAVAMAGVDDSSSDSLQEGAAPDDLDSSFTAVFDRVNNPTSSSSACGGGGQHSNSTSVTDIEYQQGASLRGSAFLSSALDPPSEEVLVEARLVVGNDDSDVFEATSMELKWRELATHPKVLAMLCVVVIVAVAIAVGVTRGSSSPSPPTTQENVWVVQDPFDLDLPNNTLEAIRVPYSPQAWANQWMLQDDNLRQYTPTRRYQRFALATFFFALGGDQWSATTPDNQWLNHSVHECDWGLRFALDQANDGADMYGGDGEHRNYTACPLHDGILRVLVMAPINAVGSLPPELFQLLTNLEVLDLSWNHGLNGTMPTEIGHLQQVKEILLTNTGLTGPIPSEIGSLTSLRMINLHHNNFGGQLPTELGLLNNVQHLFLEDNLFTGPIPSELGRMESLTSIFMEANALTGTLSPELFHNRSSLYQLSVGDNTFSGSLPPEINNLPKLRGLVLQWTGITGALPDMSRLTRLQLLMMGENPGITGTVPTEIALLTRLDMLSYDTTQLTGPIPSEFGLLPAISEIWLQNSQLEGTLPSTLGQLQSLAAFSVNNIPTLTGSIPTEFGLLENLGEFWIDGTMITGSIPAEFCELQKDGFLFDLQANCTLIECCEEPSA